MSAPVRSAEHIVLGRYAMGPAVGRGATAVVHRARDLSTGELVAVKVVPAELGIADRVDVEARAAGRLSHPGIVALRDAGRDRECLYLVYDLIEGASLAEALRSGDAPTDRGAVRMIGEVLDALAHAHARGVLHRDVKPANILIDEGGDARLSDFGVARIVDETSLTLAGSVVGTVAYMAPEQALGHPVGPAADVYAACLVLYECLTGANPVMASAPAETARRAAAAAVPPLGEVRPDLPEELTDLLEAGLSRHPGARPSAAQAAELLARVARSSPVSAVFPRRITRHLPTLGCGLAGAVLALVAVQRAGAPAGWGGTVPLAGAALAGAALAAWRPRAGAALAVVGGGALLAGAAPGMALLIAPLAALLLLSGWPHGRLILLPVLAPALFALGLGPLYAFAAGLAPRWPARLWAAVAGMCVAVGWQIAASSERLLAGGVYLDPASADLDGEASPLAAARRLWEPLGADPLILAQIGAVAVAALCVPLLLSVRPGVARALAAAGWVALLAGALAVSAGDAAAALGATIPAAIVVMVWAVWPWRIGADRAPGGVSATLPGSSS